MAEEKEGADEGDDDSSSSSARVSRLCDCSGALRSEEEHTEKCKAIKRQNEGT